MIDIHSSKYKDFLNKCCNWNATETVFLSFDVDWAPDFMLTDLMELLSNSKATFMHTHQSDIVKELINNFSSGIHPNLSNGSDQGKNIDEVINFFKNNQFDDFTLNRFHILGFSYPDLVRLSQEGLKLDSSTILFNQHHIVPSHNQAIDLISIPYFWEDGLRLTHNPKEQEHLIDFENPGCKVLDFHPIDVYLNTYSIEQRNNFKKSFKSVINATKTESEKFVNNKFFGTRDILIDLLNREKKGDFEIQDLNFLNTYMRNSLSL